MNSAPSFARQYDRLRAWVFPDAKSAGEAAAQAVAVALQEAIERRGLARLVLATGNSQLPLMAALRALEGIRWDRVDSFHLDEYVGVSEHHPASFVRYLRREIVDAVHPRAFFPIRGDAPDPESEALRYEALLRGRPIDVCCLGIGENGHVAFNEPGAADFDDPRWVRKVTLGVRSRLQQVGEGHFESIGEVPLHALSMTVPAILSADRLVVLVPERRKAEAVRQALLEPIGEACPASVLRRHPKADLFLDRESASLLP